MNLRKNLIGAGILAVALAACGGPGASVANGVPSLSDGQAGAPPAGETQASQEAAIAAYNQCVTDEGLPEIAISEDDLMGGGSGGVIIEEGGSGGPGSDGSFDGDTFDWEKFDRVNEKCAPLLDDAFGDFTMSPEQEAILKDADLAFTKCMKEQGFDMAPMTEPGTSLDTEGGTGGGNGSVIEIPDGDFEKFDEALKVCQPVLDEAMNKINAAEDGA